MIIIGMRTKFYNIEHNLHDHADHYSSHTMRPNPPNNTFKNSLNTNRLPKYI